MDLARSRIHPAWLSRMDKVVFAEALEETLGEFVNALANIHLPSYLAAKQRLRAAAVDAIDDELTLEAYQRCEPGNVSLPMAEHKK
jgi:hypothetical protein